MAHQAPRALAGDCSWKLKLQSHGLLRLRLLALKIFIENLKKYAYDLLDLYIYIYFIIGALTVRFYFGLLQLMRFLLVFF